MVRLGEFSYSVYLTHILVLSVVAKVVRVGAGTFEASTECQRIVNGHDVIVTCFGSPWFMDLFVIAQLALVIAVSHLTFAWIEMPGQRASKTFAKRLFAQVDSGAAAASKPTLM